REYIGKSARSLIVNELSNIGNLRECSPTWQKNHLMWCSGKGEVGMSRPESSAALEAIRELTRVSARLHHAVSRRSGLAPTDLSALDLLSRQVMGPADLARALDVTTAAATGIV